MPSTERDDRAEAEDHHRDDEHPEIELQPVAERVLGVGRPGRAPQAEEQQQLIAGSTVEWIASLNIAALPVSDAATNLLTAIAMLPAIAAMMTRIDDACPSISPPLRCPSDFCYNTWPEPEPMPCRNC